MEILYSDKDLAVCVKPVGTDSEHDMPQLLKEQLGGDFLPVHRLDQNVGGVMVYARTKTAAAALSAAVQAGTFIKEYVALVHGTPPQQGDWTDLLFKDSSKNKVFTVKRLRKGVKEARLEYELLRSEGMSLVRVRLHTGRSHQIRAQFASRGYPLCGDRKYGGKDEFTAPMLYSCCLQFPLKGKNYRFEHFPQWYEEK